MFLSRGDIISYTIIILFIIILLSEYLTELNIFQQSGYSLKKYLKTLKTFYISKVTSYIKLALLIVSITYLFKQTLILGFSILFLSLGIVLLNKSLILKLKFTKRMIRLIGVIGLLNIIFMLNPIGVLVLEIYLMPFFIILSNLLILPVEIKIRKHYINRAKDKLDYVSPLVIGVTGSFGKTTVKNFIYQLCKDIYISTMSKKSYNTEMGLCLSILEDLSLGDEIYIAELGATKPKDIKKLATFVNPTIGVITDIGIQHLETFKTVENILKTKLEILMSKNITTLIINSDNIYLNEFEYPKELNVIRVGQNTNANIRFTNVKYFFDHTTFDILDNNIYHVETNVVGIHNVLNIMLAYTLASHLGINKRLIIDKIKNLEMPKNRLEIKHYNQHTVIDNSFNSNVVGFYNNVSLLSLANNYKVVITPGVVELKNKSKEEHIKLAKHLMNSVNFIYLIKNKNTIYMQDEFIKNHFTNYHLCDSFDMAFKNALKNEKPSTILIENDLTDYYMNGGI